MTRKLIKKIPVLLLAAVLALALLPAAVLAEDTGQGTDSLTVLVKNTLVSVSEWRQDLKIDDLFGTDAKAGALAQREYYTEAVRTEGGYTFSAVGVRRD